MIVGHTLLSGREKLLLREVFTSVQDSGSLPGYICTYVFALIHIQLLDRKFIMEMNLLIKWKIIRLFEYGQEERNSRKPDTRKKVDVYSLSIYGLIIFPKVLGHVDGAVTDLFDQLDRRVTPVLAILVETFRSLNACQRTMTPRHDDITEERWMSILQNLQDEDVEWKDPWMVPDEILYRCGDFD
ncbi:hypothetical protein Goari_020691 [Gossypium aridum]|uniref:Uncharacterized protein n=1 Tax=Gossypium aridum TaxID=34290 RepID=A0A7J8YRK0_GOSAI|nr:hypothetical protein [Gossypium aridum]